jgi:hypothetical protein
MSNSVSVNFNGVHKPSPESNEGAHVETPSSPVSASAGFHTFPNGTAARIIGLWPQAAFNR